MNVADAVVRSGQGTLRTAPTLPVTRCRVDLLEWATVPGSPEMALTNDTKPDLERAFMDGARVRFRQERSALAS